MAVLRWFAFDNDIDPQYDDIKWLTEVVSGEVSNYAVQKTVEANFPGGYTGWGFNGSIPSYNTISPARGTSISYLFYTGAAFFSGTKTFAGTSFDPTAGTSVYAGVEFDDFFNQRVIFGSYPPDTLYSKFFSFSANTWYKIAVVYPVTGDAKLYFAPYGSPLVSYTFTGSSATTYDTIHLNFENSEVPVIAVKVHDKELSIPEAETALAIVNPSLTPYNLNPPTAGAVNKINGVEVQWRLNELYLPFREFISKGGSVDNAFPQGVPLEPTDFTSSSAILPENEPVSFNNPGGFVQPFNTSSISSAYNDIYNNSNARPPNYISFPNLQNNVNNTPDAVSGVTGNFYFYFYLETFSLSPSSNVNLTISGHTLEFISTNDPDLYNQWVLLYYTAGVGCKLYIKDPVYRFYSDEGIFTFDNSDTITWENLTNTQVTFYMAYLTFTDGTVSNEDALNLYLTDKSPVMQQEITSMDKITPLASAVQGDTSGQAITWYRGGTKLNLSNITNITGTIYPIGDENAVRDVSGTFVINTDNNTFNWQYDATDTSTIGYHIVQFTATDGTFTYVSIPQPWNVYPNWSA